MTATPETGWTEIEDAISAFAVAGSGLTSRHVIWSYYKAPRPALPFIELDITEISQVGEDWVEYDDAPDPAPGAELRVMVRGHRQIKLVIQVFGDNTGVGSAAWPILSRLVTSLSLFEAQLDDSGVGVEDVGPVQSLEGRKGSLLEPRARCVLSLHVGAELEGRETFIERVQLVTRVENAAGVELASQTLWIPDPPP